MWLRRLFIACLLTVPMWAQNAYNVPLSESLTTTPSITALKNQASPKEFFCVNDSTTAVTGGKHPALYEPRTVQLNWVTTGADWYRVYRSTVSGGPYTLTKDCIRGLAYTDTTVVSATPYYYVVTSIVAGNESAQSAEVRAGVWPDALVNRTQVLTPRTASVSLTTTPTITVRQTLRRGANESLTTADTMTRAQVLARSPSETNGTSDSIAAQGPHNKNVAVSDAVSGSDSMIRSTVDARAISQVQVTTDAITTVQKVLHRSLSDSVSESDSLSEQQGLNRRFAEGNGVSDTMTVSAPTQVWTTYGGTAIYSSGPGAIPATLFGMHFRFNKNVPTSPPYLPSATALNWPGVPFGSLRLWDTDTRWQTLEWTQNIFTWTNLDSYLRAAKFNGVNDVLLTLSSTPNWAASNPSAAPCDYGPATGYAQTGDCSPPADLNADGTGADQYWRDFVYALGSHLAGLDPATYAPVSWFEMWNEFTRGSTASVGSWLGTDAELVRMSQDANCILTGRALTISATGQTCSPSGMNETAVGLLPQSRILTPDAVPQQPDVGLLGTYLSTTGALQNVDLIAVHAYSAQGAGTTSPDGFGQTTGANNASSQAAQWAGLSAQIPAAGFGLPVWSTEGSWAATAANLADPDMQKGYVARYYLDAWSAGFQRAYWYAANNSWGTLWLQNGQSLPGGSACNDGGSGGGCSTPGAIAWSQVYSWMVGNTMTNACASDVTGSIWMCGLVTPSGKQLLAVWDSSQSCASSVCTTSSFTIPSNGYTKYYTVDGPSSTLLNGAATIAIGWKPILLSQ